MDQCDQLVLVMEPTLVSMNAVKRWLTVFNELGYDKNKINCVLNRGGGRNKQLERQLSQLSPFGQLHCVPDAFELLELAATRSESAVEANARAPFSTALAKLGQSLMEKRSNG
jgi:Flp pilus assembly CpaE family ATPase